MLTLTKMFEEVNTKEKNDIFEGKWKKICEEKGFIYISKPFSHLEKHGIKRFLIIDSKEDFIGTVEFVPYKPGGFSIINNYYDFHAVPQYIDEKDFIYEIGKLSIDIEKRPGHLEKILMTMAAFAKDNNVKRFLFAVEGELFTQLVRFGFKIKQLAPTIVSEKNTLNPGDIDVQNIFNDIENSRIIKRMLMAL